MRVLITGASGFVGRALCHALSRAGLCVRGASRRPLSVSEDTEAALVEELGPDTDWSAALAGVDAVVHLAARVHVMHDPSADPLAEFRRVNVLGTKALARAAVRSGVRRLVFVSSIKSMGERTLPGQSFDENDRAEPLDPYGISKWEAEQALTEIAAETGLEVVIVRPPLVYGPGVRANFLGLMKLASLGLPLPVARLDNRRSLVYLPNLCDALLRCTIDPRAANQLFLVADDEPLSTPELIRALAPSLAAKTRLLAVPPAMLRFAAVLTGQSAVFSRLSESLVIDSRKIREHLDWTPPFSAREGLAVTAQWYRSGRNA
ncbi:UDP-glucose 4-epimerase family protein [Methylolobus aquaticus]